MPTAVEKKDKLDVLRAARDPALIEQRRRAQARKRWVRRGIAVVLATSLVVAVAIAMRPRPVAVELAAVRRGPMQVTIEEAGRTRVRDRYVVLAPLGGDIARITLRPGDKVESGGLLARIVPQAPALLDSRSRAEATARLDTAQAAARQARADVTHAELALEHAQSDAKRMKELGAKGSISSDVAEHAEFESTLRAQELASARFAAAQSLPTRSR